jgi:SAM-dependent methyltransferase
MMTDWERCYTEGETPWNKGKPSPPMEQWVINHHPHGRALVPGCGVGHEVAMLAGQGVDAAGLDLSPTAIEMARAAYPAHADRFVTGDLFAMPAEWVGQFDYVFEHTCLCAMPPELRTDYEKAVHEVLKPGGLLVGIWFINPDMDPGESGPPFGIPVPELGVLFADSRWEIIEDVVPQIGHDGRVGRERLRVLRKR